MLSEQGVQRVNVGALVVVEVVEGLTAVAPVVVHEYRRYYDLRLLTTGTCNRDPAVSRVPSQGEGAPPLRVASPIPNSEGEAPSLNEGSIPLKPKPSENLEAARREIVERGWVQGTLIDEAGRVCAMGAIFVAAGYRVVNRMYGRKSFVRECGSQTMTDVGRGYLAEVVGGDIEGWNDTSTRTLDDVLDAFHEAAILAKEHGE